MLQALAVAVYSFGRPALRSLAPRLVPDEELAAANSLVERLQLARRASAGPAVGGLIIATAGVPWTFGIDAATYAASLLVIWWLPKLPRLRSRPSELPVDPRRVPVSEGRQALIGIFAIDTNAMVFGMPSALFPAIALHRLHGDASTVGTSMRRRTRVRSPARSCPGWCSHVRRMGLGITVMACLWGAAIAGFGFTTSLAPALACSRSQAAPTSTAPCSAARCCSARRRDHLRGRLLGIEFMQVASAPSLGDLEAGVLASLTSLRFSVVSGGLACIAGCVVDRARPPEVPPL